jgi:hypothetical protein
MPGRTVPEPPESLEHDGGGGAPVLAGGVLVPLGGCSVVVVVGGGVVVVLVGFDGWAGFVDGPLGLVGWSGFVGYAGSVVVVSAGGVVVWLGGDGGRLPVGGWWPGPGGAGQHHSHRQVGGVKSTVADAVASPSVPRTVIVSCFGCRW